MHWVPLALPLHRSLVVDRNSHRVSSLAELQSSVISNICIALPGGSTFESRKKSFTPAQICR